MDRKRQGCNCVRECPCYPHCDRMMDEGQLGGGQMPQTDAQVQMGTTPQTDAQMQMATTPQTDAQMQTGTAPQTDAQMQMGTTPQRSVLPWMRREFRDETVMAEEENEKDWMKLKEMYPDMAKIILIEVERVCDGLEYEGSMMFDEMPDRERVRSMANSIYDKVKDRYPVEELDDVDEMFVMNRETRRRYPPNQNWLNDMIQVLLFQEMYRRRCRHRNCRRW